MQEIKKKKPWYYDLEQFENFHSAYFISMKGEERYFIIHESRNDIVEYVEFLQSEVKSLMGFNCLEYDYPMIHFILEELTFHRNDWEFPHKINSLLYSKSYSLIHSEGYRAIPHWKVIIPQLDIFKILHFDNVNNSCSLKKVEFIIRFGNVDDIDVGNIKTIETKDIPEIIKYNRNDALATKKLIESYRNDIQLRKSISKLYKHYGKLDWMNFNDAKIGSTIFTVPLAKELGISVKELRELRTERPQINVRSLILPYVNFKTPEFNQILSMFKSKTIYGTKKPFEFEAIFKDVKYVYGVGGLHGSIKAGEYYAEEGYSIVEVDVASYYPNLSIRNKFFPEHLGKIFCEIYESMFDQRMESKAKVKQGIDVEYNNLIVSLFKLALNGSYGKTNDKYSFLYDPEMTMKICINGQLLLSMLVERLVINVPEIMMIYANTDGICFKIPNFKLDRMRKICKMWEKLTKLELEEDLYKGVIIRDVNNYLKIKDGNLYPSQPKSTFYDNSYTEHGGKGCFEVVKTKNGKVSFAKNWSAVVVQKAIYNHYVNGEDVRHSILNHDDIFDFYMFHKNSKSPKNGEPIEAFMVYDKNPDVLNKLSKSTRYYVSTDGGRMIKINRAAPSRKDSVHKKKRCTIANVHVEKNMEEYNIDYSYYINECFKIINVVENNFQTKLL